MKNKRKRKFRRILREHLHLDIVRIIEDYSKYYKPPEPRFVKMTYVSPRIIRFVFDIDGNGRRVNVDFD